MSIAFVIGNGTSRKPIPLEPLKAHGTLYACNAVYRSGLRPDYLVAVDTKMVTEINNSKYQHHNNVWTNPNKLYEKFHCFNYFADPLGWSSGPTALWLASYGADHQHSEIYILGFDYEGIEGKINNLYANTQNYKRSEEVATYHGNWSRQTGIVIQKNVGKRYIRVVENEDDYCPDNLRPLGNLSHITVAQFTEKFVNLQS
jgi:hypothetical protein|tara:strand:+ start:38002 stop:38604 length:603 start_codon:yes stop_codon:yes gene_type:complete